VRPTLQPT